MRHVAKSSPFELDPEALACPYSFYDELRSTAPVVFVDALGAWAVTRYDHIREVLGNTESFSNRYATGPKYAQLMRKSMAEVLSMTDAPETANLAARRWGRSKVLLTAD